MKGRMSTRTAREILIVDDHSLFRQGLRRLLEEDGRFTVVAQAASGYEAIRQVDTHRPALVLLDIQLPGLTGLSIASTLRERHPDLKIVFLTMQLDDERLFVALKAGAYGFLTKDIDAEELLDSLERVASGERIIEDIVLQRPEFALPILTEVRSGSEQFPSSSHAVPHSLKHPLSVRESEVLDCVAQGLSNKQIGNVLFISEQTVKNHMSSVLRKLSAEHRLQAVVSALRYGWIDIPASSEMVAD